MSELIDIRTDRTIIRRQLLATASVLALTAYIASTGIAEAEDSSRPTVWIELGGQLDGLNAPEQAFSPPFMGSITQANLLSALNVQKPSAYAIDEDAKISFQPDDSNWVFSASVRYGRSNATRDRHQQTANKTVTEHFTVGGFVVGPKYYYPTLHAKFADGQAKRSETHNVLDFQVGKDVGLGLFGGHGSSILSAGVRVAQFTSKSSTSLRAEPDLQYPTAPISSLGAVHAFKYLHIHFHDYAAMANNQRNFRGLGPSLAWSASLPFAGDSRNDELSFDWSVNGAVLFGRQKASGNHKTTVQSYYRTHWHRGFQQGRVIPGYFGNQAAFNGRYFTGPTAHHSNAKTFNRARTVVVPNIGGSVGLSFRIEDFKVAVGYRADFFFGAMDGGIDTAKSENRSFYGPFASVSVGLGG